MSKKKMIIISACALLVLVGAVALFLILNPGKKDEDDTPVSNTPKQENTLQADESDVEVDDYEEFDWQGTANNKKDESFHENRNETTKKDDTTKTEQSDKSGGLKYDESKNTGIEVDFDSWDKE